MLDPHRYCKLGGSGGHAPPETFFKFKGSEILFPAFSAGHLLVNKYEGQCNN